MSLSSGLSSKVALKEPSFALCTPGRMACSHKQHSASLLHQLHQPAPAHTLGPHSTTISTCHERMPAGSTTAPACAQGNALCHGHMHCRVKKVCFLQKRAAAGPLTFLMVPRMPETVRTEAPSNLATSSWEVNMPETKAVWRAILTGVPTSFSFLTTFGAASSPSTTPVALTRHPCASAARSLLQRCIFTKRFYTTHLQDLVPQQLNLATIRQNQRSKYKF